MTHKQKHLKKNRLPNWVIVALVLIGSVLLTWMLSAASLEDGTLYEKTDLNTF